MTYMLELSEKKLKIMMDNMLNALIENKLYTRSDGYQVKIETLRKNHMGCYKSKIE